MVKKILLCMLIFFAQLITASNAERAYCACKVTPHTFNAVLAYMGLIHHQTFEQLGSFIVFNDGLTSHQMQQLQEIEKVFVLNIPEICVNCEESKFDYEQDQIKRKLLQQLSLLLPHCNSFLWLDEKHLMMLFEHAQRSGIYYTPRKKEASLSKKFVIIIPSYNNEEWVEYNLVSALNQSYDNFRIIFINDNSRDSTLARAREIIAHHDTKSRVLLIDNNHRIGALANFYRAIYLCEPDEIVVMLDGDDWLIHDQVLAVLNQTYYNSDTWITYGQFVEYPTNYLGGARQLPQEIIEQALYREYDWVTSHLRTFYAGLFHKIRVGDLQKEGTFFPMAWDLAIMFPILEMAGHHSQFIPHILYHYNRATPINDNKVNRDLQISLENYIRTLPKYATRAAYL